MSSSAIGATGAIAALPSGVMIDYAATVAPSGWLMCDGNAIDRTVFASLFATIGTTYGNGDGSTTFNLPDFRGRFARYMDNMGTPAGAASRDTGRVLGATAQTQTTAKNGLTTVSAGAHAHGVNARPATTGGAFFDGVTNTASGTSFLSSVLVTDSQGAHTHTIAGDAETRPINLACNRIIKT